MRRQEVAKLRGRARRMGDDIVKLVGADGRTDKGTAARVALRRMVGRSPEHPYARAAHAYLARYTREDDNPAVERAFYAVAAMIAAQPRDAREATDRTSSEESAEENTDEQPVDAEAASDEEPVQDVTDDPPSGAGDDAETTAPRGTSLGATLGQATATGKRSFDTTEARLHLLCRQGVPGIHRHLPRLVARLRADLVPIDWPELTVDLARWGSDRDLVVKQWLQDFYRVHNRITAGIAKNPKTPDGDASGAPDHSDIATEEGEDR